MSRFSVSFAVAVFCFTPWVPGSLWAQTRVACVGDSITEGYGLASPQQDAYPPQLQRLLGSEYDVRDFGVSGSTAQQAGDRPYWREAKFTESTAFSPELVLLMLGTNDVKAQNWDEARFRAEYLALVDHYEQVGARVLVATPPKVFGDGAFGIGSREVNDVLVPLVREMAQSSELPLVEVFLATEDHPEWFSDLIHPSSAGAGAIAAAFAEAVNRVLAPPPAETASPTDDGSDPSQRPPSTAPMGETTDPEASSDATAAPNSTAAPSPAPPGSSQPGTSSAETSQSGTSGAGPAGTTTGPSLAPEIPSVVPGGTAVMSSDSQHPTKAEDSTPASAAPSATGGQTPSDSPTAPATSSGCAVGQTRGSAWETLAILCVLSVVRRQTTRRRTHERSCSRGSAILR